jgi:hypothetical protein
MVSGIPSAGVTQNERFFSWDSVLIGVQYVTTTGGGRKHNYCHVELTHPLPKQPHSHTVSFSLK